MTVLFAGSLWQRLRLASGLTLFAFAATHFLNHALGLVSFETMEAVHEVRTASGQSFKTSEPRSAGMEPRPGGTAVRIRPTSAEAASIFARPAD